MKKLKILLAEDSDVDRDQVIRDLRRPSADFPFTVEFTSVSNREHYEAALRGSAHDLVLLDFKLDNMNGEEALDLWKRLQPETPIIVLTGSIGDDKAASIATQYGAADYVIKDRQARLKTAIKTAYERREDKRQKAKLQGVELLGTLAAGMAHDLNNILGCIAAAATLVKIIDEDTEKTEQEKVEAKAKALELITNSAMRGGEIVQQMNNFAKGSEDSAYKSVTAEYLLGQIGQMVRDKAFSKILKTFVSTDVGTAKVRCAPTQIYQVLLNLCVNARDAMPNGGELHISAYNVARAGGQYVCIRVRDTGSGIPEEIMPKIFSWFFTTKGPKGSGVGLALVKEILDDHGGMIEVRSKIGEGTTFMVYLPADVEQKPKEKFDGGGKVILLVDDELLFRTAIHMHLEAANYKVLTAANGPEALAHFRMAERIDLLLTDTAMPIMCGRELVRNIRAAGFTLPVVFLSGSDALIPGDLDAAASLRKPIPIRELFETLRTVLTGDGQVRKQTP